MRYLLIIGAFVAGHILCAQPFIKKTYYDEEKTKIKEIVSLNPKDSTLEGRYQSFFVSGSLASAGYYHLDKPDSVWIFHFENGNEKATGKYRQGVQTGIWKYHFENGNKKATGTLNGTIKQGYWTFYYENGKSKSEGLFFQNQKEGIWNYYYEDGLLKAQAFYQKGKGTYKEFFPTGSLRMEGVNVEDKSEGEWTYYYESGEKEAIGQFQNGLRNGKWTYFHENGQIAAEGQFVDSEKQGVWKYFFDDGTLRSEGEMVSDQKDGFWKLYYLSGQVKGEGKYDQGTGLYNEYYENGKQKSKGRYENGQKTGDWVYYNEDGLEDGKATFVNGEGEYNGYYPDGSRKMTGTLSDDRRVGEWILYNPDGSVAGMYRPVYEDDKPIFRTAESIKAASTKTQSDKPEYLFKNNKIRYFQPRINEYKGLIVGTNPLWTLIGQWPLAFEYYIQERLGYEAEFTLYKKPFFTSAGINELGTKGATIAFRQKFYHSDQKMGMFYFGHQLTAGYLQHHAIALDSSIFIGLPPERTPLNASETRIGYGLFVGDRWMQRAGDSGFTIDFHLGLSVVKRFYSADFERAEDKQGLFKDITKNPVFIPIIFGINIGYAGPKRRTNTF